VLASHLTHALRHDDAIRQAKEAMDIDDTNIAPYTTLGEAYVAVGLWAEAVQALEKACRLQPQFTLTTGLLAGALVRIGERARAEELIRDMGDAPRPLMGKVLYHWVCSESEQAADLYERTINARDPFALVFANGPLGSRFRESSRWPKLAKMMSLPPTTISRG
jgi:tetratricopeptide (TPR) repeat protein